MAHTIESRKRAYEKTKHNRAMFFQGKVCVKCKSDKNLELDHIDPKNKSDHNIWSWSEKEREKEITKCQVLCHDCHKIKTKEDLRKMFSKPIMHGTAAAYEHKGCRCDLCRNARKNARRIRKDRNGKWS